ncbi:MAG: SDR family oxidoreductase [Cyanophyceae cyanobacterium]
MASIPLSEQVILITGASTGIGAALARTLATNYRGVRLAIAARHQDQLEQVAADCRQAGADVLAIPTDIGETEQAKALAYKAVAHFDRVDAVINNAGYGQMGPIEMVPTDAAKRQFAVNFHGPLALTQALIPVMRDRGGGRIINVSSLGGRMAFPAGGLYSASKFALEALTDVLRMELKAFNIHAIVVEPGPVKTKFFEVANRQAERTMPHPEKTPYQAVFEKIAGIEQQTEKLGWEPAKVAQVIVRALTDRHPRPRYVAATGGRMLLFLMTKVLPTWVTDRFWKRFYGIDRVEKDWQSAKGQRS